VPSEADTEKAAVAMAQSMKSRDDVQRAVRAIKSTLRSSAASQRRAATKHKDSLVLSSPTTMLAQIDGTNSVDGLGLDVGSFSHFEDAAARADYYEKHSKYDGAPRSSPSSGESAVAERVREAAAREAAARKAERAERQAAVNAAMLTRVKTVRPGVGGRGFGKLPCRLSVGRPDGTGLACRGREEREEGGRESGGRGCQAVER
jgi:hypothetical protein